jgi:ribonuclease P protein component
LAKQFTLGKKERLKSRKLIAQLFSEGENFPYSPFRVYYLFCSLPNSSTPALQFAISVPAKNFKRAIDRNRIKRLTREAYRLQKNALQEKLNEKKLQLNIFFVYTAKEFTDFNTVKEKLKLILSKMLVITHENRSSNS